MAVGQHRQHGSQSHQMLFIDHTFRRQTFQLPGNPVIQKTGDTIGPGVIALWLHQHGVDQIVVKLWEWGVIPTAVKI